MGFKQKVPRKVLHVNTASLFRREKPFQKKVVQIFVDKQSNRATEQEDVFTIVSLDESFFSFMILSNKKSLD